MISFRTVSGQKIDLERPVDADINIDDIATGLSNCCRYAGQVPKFYSVAQHSVLVSHLVGDEFKLPALLHDAAEAYLGDLSRNVKHHPTLRGFRELEEVLQCVIVDKYHAGTTWSDYNEYIKPADNVAAMYEHLMFREGVEGVREEDVRRLLAEGFVENSYEELLPFWDRFPKVQQPVYGLTVKSHPEVWPPWEPEEARFRFLQCFEAFRG